jgi:predicted RNase H-like nuclease (RuvC/YqgF family)
MVDHIRELEICIEAISSLEKSLLNHQQEVEKLKASIEFFRKRKGAALIGAWVAVLQKACL